jgi:peptidoglycan/xylan/chitin deacetylase (PgdA/CDA1 family)
MPLSPSAPRDPAGPGERLWLRTPTWRALARPDLDEKAGEVVERFTLDDGTVLSARLDDRTGQVSVPFNLAEAYEALVYERWRDVAPGPGLSSRQLELYYVVKPLIPRSVQLRARRRLIRRQLDPEFPQWPLDETVCRLVRFYARCLLLGSGETELTFRWFWPRPYEAALILTHDVESEDGLRRAVEIADLEEERGLRSSFNIVADWYPIDWGIVDELRGRGFELGVHGVHHDRSMFSSRASFDSQQPAVREMADRLGAVGFRSPATHRVIDWLGDLPVDYDCSVPHSDPFEPQPGGCCSVWPFFVGDVVELPITLPQDHTIFTLLEHPSVALWEELVERIVRLNGMIEVLTHPDPGYLADPAKRGLYREFLDFVKDRPEVWKTLPRDAASWWRERDRLDASGPELALGVARLGEEVTLELDPAA